MDYKKAHEDEEKRLKEGGLTARMDADELLLYLDKYVMRDADGEKVSDIINVTLNRPAVFAANVISALGSTSEQVIVESEDKKLDTTYIEDFQKSGFRAANDRLTSQGRNYLNPTIDEQICIRGGASDRCLFRMEGEQLIPDITPWDFRFVTYEKGVKGLEWAAYKVQKSKRQIEAELWAKDREYTIPGKEASVLEIWHTEGSELWVDKKKIFEQEHSYGFTPVVIQVVTLGSMLASKNSPKHQGESIFFLIRDVIPELNRLASIMQTLNLKAALPPMGWGSKDGRVSPKYQDATGMATITPTEIGGGAKPVDYGDAKRSAMQAYAMLDKALQEGSLSSIDLGTLQFQLSAVALIEIGEGRDQVFTPRLHSKALLNEALAEMFTEQVIQIGGSVELGTRGHKRQFQTSKLQGEYETTYKYFVKSPKIDIARYSVASAAERYLDEASILKDVLQVEDPDGIMQKRYYDMAAKISPSVLKTRVIRALYEDGGKDSEFEADLMAAEMGMDLKRIMAGEIPEAPKERPEPKPILPLLGEGGGRTSARKASELQRTPLEGEGEE